MPRLSRRALLAGAVPAWAAAPPYGAVPSERQLQWHRRELYAFLHFTINTFTDKEWGYGDESPDLFNPAAFDADAIVAALKAGGMRAVILTAKHHDGFCLWPTATTPHSVRSCAWRNGRGDVVREISDAARRQGLAFGVYLSPWDRNHPRYASPGYVAAYREQLRELLTGYGDIFEVWHDGANGGDGFYGGARERRTIDKRSYYDWPATWELVRKLQPGAVIFSDVGPDIRWVGNERGIAEETCWATYDPVGERGGPASPGDVDASRSGRGTPHGSRWLPAECDVSIRPGWFWHERENSRVKTPRQLADLYFKSVGRGASFLLNVPPDRRGLLHENDTASLAAFGRYLETLFAANLAAGAKTNASELLDAAGRSRWAATRDAVFDLPRPAEFDVIRLREHLPMGQRVDSFAVDVWRDGRWAPLATGTTIGSCRLVRLDASVRAQRLRLSITRSTGEPVLAHFGLYREPAL